MSNHHDDNIDLIMQGDWSKAFITLNQRSPAELEKAKKRFRWMSLVMPNKKVGEYLKGK
jgi:hypothetical protein